MYPSQDRPVVYVYANYLLAKPRTGKVGQNQRVLIISGYMFVHSDHTHTHSLRLLAVTYKRAFVR